MNDALLDCIEEWAERLANADAATQIPLPPAMHVDGLTSSIRLTLREMCEVLRAEGREVPLWEDKA